ncbi:MAG: substrate-binding domain-containing protein [Gammaproteobacteria bacterium]|nr:substrate-binding domain-containing protein [Gammaproteobacteria bacterium]
MSEPVTLRILSAGAPKTGVRLCVEAFSQLSATEFQLEFATAPVIKQRMEEGTADADVLVAPGRVMDELLTGGSVDAGSTAELGSVTAGVVVRNGAEEPDLSSVENFTRTLLDADKLVFNQASSGQYVEKMLAGLGVAEQVAAKIVRTKTGAAVMEHLAADTHAKAIGFGQITEIRLKQDLGVHLVGPLPEAIGNVTVYRAGVPAQSREPELGNALVRFMVSEQGKQLFVSTGVI